MARRCSPSPVTGWVVVAGSPSAVQVCTVGVPEGFVASRATAEVGVALVGPSDWFVRATGRTNRPRFVREVQSSKSRVWGNYGTPRIRSNSL